MGTSTPAAPPEQVAFPPAVTAFEHGGTYWFVAVVVARTEDDPRLAEAEKSLHAAGYGDEANRVLLSGCDSGLREGLALDPEREYFHVSLAFRTPELAQQFVDAYQPGVVGTAQVVTYCLD